MNSRIKKLQLVVTIILVVLLIQPNVIKAATKESVGSDTGKKLLEDIITKNPEYKDDKVEVVQDDFDNNGSQEYFYLFTKEGTITDDFNGISADIWFGGTNGVKRILEWSEIQQDSFGRISLGGKKYFRFDLTYATAINTVLYGVKNGKCVKEFSGAYMQLVKGSNDFTAIFDCYDMVAIKQDGITVGHTWKPYYYYADAKGIHEYGAKKISDKDFLKYGNSKQIIKKIKAQYSKEGKVKLSYLKRSNGLIHINISCETKDSIYYYYKTYRISKKNELSYIAADDESGNYRTELDKKIAVY